MPWLEFAGSGRSANPACRRHALELVTTTVREDARRAFAHLDWRSRHTTNGHQQAPGAGSMRGGASRDWWKFGRWGGLGGGMQKAGGRGREWRLWWFGGGFIEEGLGCSMHVRRYAGAPRRRSLVVSCGPALGENQWLQR